MSGDDVWVFAYASLIWRPDFPFAETRLARLYGYHRALCIYSHIYRGSRARPGLVAGLVPGGSCRGLACRVRARDRDKVIETLNAREMITGVYAPRWVRVRLDEGGGVEAYTFVADRAHSQFAGRLGVSETARILARARGSKGSGGDYLENTVAHLEALGIRDSTFEKVLAELRGLSRRARRSASKGR